MQLGREVDLRARIKIHQSGSIVPETTSVRLVGCDYDASGRCPGVDESESGEGSAVGEEAAP